MVAEVDSLDQYKIKYCQNFVKKYSGEKGLLKAKDGTELLCKFEAGQLENGTIILICDFSIFDLDCQKFFSELCSKNISSHNLDPQTLKWLMAWNISTGHNEAFQQLEKIESFSGITFDGFDISGKVGICIDIDYNPDPCKPNSRVKIEYSFDQLTVSGKENEKTQCVVFGVTNFKFTGRCIKLDIEGIKKLTIEKRKTYNKSLDILKISKGVL